MERIRLVEAGNGKVQWKKWGPYLSERQWGTVREDYSENGDAWNFFTHDHARSRAYCWGEDVKEYYFYLDSTPTHSYMKYLYKYPQAAYPYDDLVRTNGTRSREEMEYELLDTGVFNEDRYFDVFVEYAKEGPEDILVKITAINRGPEASELHLLPTLWFRNDSSAWIAESNTGMFGGNSNWRGPVPTGTTTSYFTSTTMVPDWEPVIRQAGVALWLSSYSYMGLLTQNSFWKLERELVS